MRGYFTFLPSIYPGQIFNPGAGADGPPLPASVVAITSAGARTARGPCSTGFICAEKAGASVAGARLAVVTDEVPFSKDHFYAKSRKMPRNVMRSLVRRRSLLLVLVFAVPSLLVWPVLVAYQKLYPPDVVDVSVAVSPQESRVVLLTGLL